MKELLSIIQKLKSSNENYTFVSRDISKKEINKLLKWYDGNIYNISYERIEHALKIILWCYEMSDLDYLPRAQRNESFKTASTEFQISHEKLVKMFKYYTEMLSSNTKKTKVIAFEGIDGSGKTVQMSLIEEKLKKANKKICVKSFPVYDSFFGKNIGKLLSGNEEADANNVDPKSMSLWYALDRWKNFENFNYTDYDYLLLNRFTLSSAVYQSSRVQTELQSEVVQWVFDLEHSQLGLPSPDLYIVFDLNTETSKKNVSTKGYRDYLGDKADVYEDSADIMTNARNIYKQLSVKHDNIVIIDCLNEDGEMKNPEEINDIVMKVVEDGEY